MSFEDLLDHKCDIYHYTNQSVNKGYGFTENKYSYPDAPDEKDISCHFHVTDTNIKQDAPMNKYPAHIKVDFPADANIKLNDKVVWKDGSNTFSYTAEIPRNIRGHHIVVFVNRDGAVKEAL